MIAVTSSIERVNPEQAKKYLETQKINRVPTNNRVKDYAMRMARGEWKISQPLQFTDEGDLFDGQHRLLAVIESGISCDFIVIRGLPSETRQYVDIGQTRSTGQIAQLMNLGTCLNGKLATCKAMFIGGELKSKNNHAENNAKKQYTRASASQSPQLIIDLYLKHKEAIDFAQTLISPSSAPVRAVVARAYTQENRKRLREFVEVFNSGFPITPVKDDAAIALRNALLKMKSDKVGELMQE